MCATFQLSSSDAAEIKNICEELTKKYGAEKAAKAVDSDFFPKSEVPVIGGENKVSLLKWGFPIKGDSRTLFNARAESLFEKQMYRGLLNNRCLVPATSFYEWDSEKRKYKIAVSNTKLFYMAALWKAEKLADGSKTFYFTIITTEPNELVGTIHKRMPAIISPRDSELWLSSAEGFKLLKPFEEKMTLAAV